MKYRIRFDSQFTREYAQLRHDHVQLADELDELIIEELAVNGTVPDAYRPHMLANPGGNYNGHWEFHLSEGAIDVLVLYLPHHSNPIIRLVRIASHDELFQGRIA
ncbi:type II toxin-antitoxin system mRNA interferase toxin, RelE/StbE family [Bifidobacterium crudilactis]|jgi:mRNA interferase YafQ|uniref:type II toxin-antitoxin system mRNA interferase toxin, RelE/StbE family n=1 Tax=Bifidobacterium crudilactis TaxID=327277 RepID=UPI00054D2E96|nr:type II toxin-antitoxin system mRNA interferase toxin, RelE/StbE family [Bifidobacterium crudilactis]MCI2148199.1 type II toxin-antitoxin system YafQ family toxin [Bifidobacterium crudilactis]MCI2157892.1 type II toxin-antitoxin system YafQ family toxin [Bifidobacterium crudilactis]